MSDAVDSLNQGDMRTRDVLRWHHSVRDLRELALIAIAGLALGILDAGATALERWIDGR